MEGFINTITPFLHQHRYIFAFLGSFFEGTNIMLLSGFLSRLGVFKFLNVLAVLSLGYFLNGYGWFFLGRFWGKTILEKWGPHFFLTKERLEKLEDYFEKNTEKTLIISRITYGLSMYTFTIAGMLRTKAKKFFWCNLISTFIWVFVLFFIGYIFGTSYALLSKLVKLIAVWLVVLLFVIIALTAILLVFWLRRSAEIRFLEKTINREGWEKVKQIGKNIVEFFDKFK